MATVYFIRDRRRPFASVLGDCLVAVLAIPMAAWLAAPDLPGAEAAALLRRCALALLLLNLVVYFLEPTESAVWSVPRAIIAGAWRASLMVTGLVCVLLSSGEAGRVPLGLLLLAWGALALGMAAARVIRLVTSRRVPF